MSLESPIEPMHSRKLARRRADTGALGDMALTTRAAIRSTGIADPRILGKPLVRRPTQRTMCATEEYWGGVEG